MFHDIRRCGCGELRYTNVMNIIMMYVKCSIWKLECIIWTTMQYHIAVNHTQSDHRVRLRLRIIVFGNAFYSTLYSSCSWTNINCCERNVKFKRPEPVQIDDRSLYYWRCFIQIEKRLLLHVSCPWCESLIKTSKSTKHTVKIKGNQMSLNHLKS